MGHIQRMHHSSVVAMALLDEILSKLTDGDLVEDHKSMVVSMLEEIITAVVSEVIEEDEFGISVTLVVSQDMEFGQEIIEEDDDGISVTAVVSETMEFGQEIIEEEDEGISEYVKARNARVADIQAEFDRQFPSFRKEVRELSLVKELVKRKPRKVRFETPVRKSSRIQELPLELDEESQTGDRRVQDTLSVLDGGPGVAVEAGMVQNSGDVASGKEADDIVTEINSMEVVGVGHLETGAGDIGAMYDACAGEVDVIVVESITEVEVETGINRREALESGAGGFGVMSDARVGEVETDIVVEVETTTVEASTAAANGTTVETGTDSVGSGSLGKFACIPCEKPFR